jgi:hypothetical protein
MDMVHNMPVSQCWDFRKCKIWNWNVPVAGLRQREQFNNVVCFPKSGDSMFVYCFVEYVWLDTVASTGYDCQEKWWSNGIFQA